MSRGRVWVLPHDQVAQAPCHLARPGSCANRPSRPCSTHHVFNLATASQPCASPAALLHPACASLCQLLQLPHAALKKGASHVRNAISSRIAVLCKLLKPYPNLVFSGSCPQQDASRLPPNPTLEHIPDAIAAAATASGHVAAGGVVVMVVQPGERNAYDQQVRVRVCVRAWMVVCGRVCGRACS